VTTVGNLETFRAKLGTTFRYRADLTGEVYVQFEDREGAPARVAYQGNVTTTIQIPLEDLMEFVAHVSGVPETPEGMGAIATAHVMEQLRQAGVFTRATPAAENAAREIFLDLFTPKKPLEPLDEYDRQTKELASAHVASCVECGGVDRCVAYWRVMLDRIRAKNRSALQ